MTRADWIGWRRYLSTLPATAERSSKVAAMDRALDTLSESDPMFEYHPHDWTAADVDRHVAARCAA